MPNSYCLKQNRRCLFGVVYATTFTVLALLLFGATAHGEDAGTPTSPPRLDRLDASQYPDIRLDLTLEDVGHRDAYAIIEWLSQNPDDIREVPREMQHDERMGPTMEIMALIDAWSGMQTDDLVTIGRALNLAVQEPARWSPRDDRMAVATTADGSRLTVTVPFTGNTGAVQNGIQQVERLAGAETSALYDLLLDALTEFDPPAAPNVKRYLFLFSNGYDINHAYGTQNESNEAIEAIKNLARDYSIQIVPFCIPDKSHLESECHSQSRMHEFADVESIADLSRTISELLPTSRALTVSYRSSTDGNLAPIAVGIKVANSQPSFVSVASPKPEIRDVYLSGVGEILIRQRLTSSVPVTEADANNAGPIQGRILPYLRTVTETKSSPVSLSGALTVTATTLATSEIASVIYYQDSVSAPLHIDTDPPFGEVEFTTNLIDPHLPISVRALNTWGLWDEALTEADVAITTYKVPELPRICDNMLGVCLRTYDAMQVLHSRLLPFLWLLLLLYLLILLLIWKDRPTRTPGQDETPPTSGTSPVPSHSKQAYSPKPLPKKDQAELLLRQGNSSIHTRVPIDYPIVEIWYCATNATPSENEVADETNRVDKVVVLRDDIKEPIIEFCRIQFENDQHLLQIPKPSTAKFPSQKTASDDPFPLTDGALIEFPMAGLTYVFMVVAAEVSEGKHITGELPAISVDGQREDVSPDEAKTDGA